MVQELLTACAATDAGEAPQLGPPLPLIPAEDELFPDTLPGRRKRPGIAGFLFRQMADELGFRFRTIGKRRPPVHPRGNCRVLCRRLAEEDTTALVRACRSRRLTLGSALNAAMLYHGMLRVTVPMPSGTGLWATASVVNEKISSAARRGDSLWSVKLSTAMMRPILRQQKQRMGTTALSYTGPSRLPRRFGSIEVSSPDVFISNLTLGPEYTAQARLADGELHWNIVYLDCDMDRAMADRISDEMLIVLRTGSAGGTQ
jgi:hypothetical protein